MRGKTIIFGLAVALLGATSEASAQELTKPAPRQGYYIGGGLRQFIGGAGGEVVGSFGFMQGFGVALRFGQMATDHIGLGLVFGGGGSANKSWAVGGGHLSMELTYKPLDDYDLGLRGGIGFGVLSATRAEEEDVREDDPEGGIGAQFTLGVSYDLFPFYEPKEYESGGFAFTGFAELTALPADPLWSVNFVIGLEVTYWFGLAKNKLELPADKAFELDD